MDPTIHLELYKAKRRVDSISSLRLDRKTLYRWRRIDANWFQNTIPLSKQLYMCVLRNQQAS